MTLTVTNTIDKSTSKHASMKLAKDFINQEVVNMNEEQKEYYYTSTDFKISE